MVAVSVAGVCSSFRIGDDGLMTRRLEMLRILDQVKVGCPRCKLGASLYFNIDEIPYVKEMGVVPEMAILHLNTALDEQKARDS